MWLLLETLFIYLFIFHNLQLILLMISSIFFWFVAEELEMNNDMNNSFFLSLSNHFIGAYHLLSGNSPSGALDSEALLKKDPEKSP